MGIFGQCRRASPVATHLRRGGALHLFGAGGIAPAIRWRNRRGCLRGKAASSPAQPVIENEPPIPEVSGYLVHQHVRRIHPWPVARCADPRWTRTPACSCSAQTHDSDGPNVPTESRLQIIRRGRDSVARCGLANLHLRAMERSGAPSPLPLCSFLILHKGSPQTILCPRPLSI